MTVRYGTRSERAANPNGMERRTGIRFLLASTEKQDPLDDGTIAGSPLFSVGGKWNNGNNGRGI
jgi:hypothetical protein